MILFKKIKFLISIKKKKKKTLKKDFKPRLQFLYAKYLSYFYFGVSYEMGVIHPVSKTGELFFEFVFRFYILVILQIRYK